MNFAEKQNLKSNIFAENGIAEQWLKDVKMVENENGRFEPERHLFLGAVSPVTDYRKLQITSNYGEVEGKVVKKTKTYSHVSAEASFNAIYSVGEAIDAMQLPTAENYYYVSRDELIEE